MPLEFGDINNSVDQYQGLHVFHKSACLQIDMFNYTSGAVLVGFLRFPKTPLSWAYFRIDVQF